MRRLSWAALISAVLAALSLNPSPNPPVESTAPDTTWTVVFGKAPPPASRPPGGSRGDDQQIYVISPGQIGKAELWSDQPLFIWHGEIRQIELATATGTMWSQAIAGDTRSIRYPKTPLRPGQTYEWIIYSAAKVAVAKVAFRVMDAIERNRIATDLEALAAQRLDATPEQIALQRASYFADRQLWADVLQEALSIAEPSHELVSALSQFWNR